MTSEEWSVSGLLTGLTLDDHMDDRLYWCDSKENLVESIKLDGSDRVIVVGKGLDNPVSLDVFGDSLYWASQQMGAVMKMDKFGRGVNVTLQTGLLLPSSVRIMHPKRHNLSGGLDNYVRLWDVHKVLQEVDMAADLSIPSSFTVNENPNLRFGSFPTSPLQSSWYISLKWRNLLLASCSLQT